MKRTPIRRVSSKRRAAHRDRLEVLGRWHGPQPCQRCAAAEAVDAHEVLSRARGGSISDPDNIVPLCRACHTWITAHPTEAKDAGWLASRKSPRTG